MILQEEYECLKVLPKFPLLWLLILRACVYLTPCFAMLFQAATSEAHVEGLAKSYERLVKAGLEGMGSSYQALAIVRGCLA